MSAEGLSFTPAPSPASPGAKFRFTTGRRRPSATSGGPAVHRRRRRRSRRTRCRREYRISVPAYQEKSALTLLPGRFTSHSILELIYILHAAAPCRRQCHCRRHRRLRKPDLFDGRIGTDVRRRHRHSHAARTEPEPANANATRARQHSRPFCIVQHWRVKQGRSQSALLTHPSLSISGARRGPRNRAFRAEHDRVHRCDIIVKPSIVRYAKSGPALQFPVSGRLQSRIAPSSPPRRVAWGRPTSTARTTHFG